jgi:hypothetical protein
VPGLLSKRLLNRYFNFCFKHGKKEKIKGWHKHHVHPEKMGGSDTFDNWVWLSPRAHYIAHHLLFRAFPKNQAAQRSAWLMSHVEDIRVTSRMYQFLKDNYVFNEETREKLRKAGMGREYTQDQINKISESNRVTYANTPEDVLEDRRKRMSETKSGVPWTEEQRAAITPSLPRGENHWRLKDDPLWERREEIYNTWEFNGRPAHKKLCKLLGIPTTKKVISIAKSMI